MSHIFVAEQYYQLKYLTLLRSQPNVEHNLIYNEVTNEFIYIFEDGYELVMSNKTYSFVTSIEYVKLVIYDDYAIRYDIGLSREEIGQVLYSSFTIPLLSLYVIGILVYSYVLKDKKRIN